MLKFLVRALIALIIAVLATRSLAGWGGEQLDDAARAALLRSGEAQQFIKLPMGTMHVRVSGPANGPVVLLVHGGVVGGYGFQNWQQPLARAGYRVIVPDLLGYGFSDRPDVPYTKSFYVAQLNQLLDALEIKTPVHIVGASLGGAIVTAFTVRTPARVKSVVLVAPAGGGRVQVVNGVLLWPVVGDFVFGVFGAQYMKDMMMKAYEHSPDRDNMARWMAAQTRFRGYPEGILNTLRNYDAAWQPEDYEALGRSSIPVLAVWGTADTVNAFAQSKELMSRVPQMKLAPLEGKGHAITYGESNAILAAVIPFFRK